MRRYDTGQANQPAAGSFAQVVVIEIFQLVLAHVHSSISRVVERDELPVTAGDFELANYEGRSASRVRLSRHRQPERERTRYYDCRAGCLEYFFCPPHSRGDCKRPVRIAASIGVLQLPKTLNFLI